MTIPVFIPSKGRPEYEGAIKSCAERNPVVFVEPQEEWAYKAAHPGVEFVVIDDNNRGLAYVRQAMLDYARKLGVTWYWQVDDDNFGFSKRDLTNPKFTHEKLTSCTFAEAAACCELVAAREPKAALVALDYYGTSVCRKDNREVLWNCNTAGAVLTRTDTGIDYWPDTEREDFEYSLHHLVECWKTAVVCQYVMHQPRAGTLRGGCYESYHNGKIAEWAKKLMERYPGIVYLTRAQSDVNAFWQLFDEQANTISPCGVM